MIAAGFPAAAGVAARQVRRLAQAACPKLGIELAVTQVVGVQDEKTAQGEVVQQFPKDGRERLVRDFVGRQERDVFVGKPLCRGRPVFGFRGTKLLFKRGIWRVNLRKVVGAFVRGLGDFPVHVRQTERIIFGRCCDRNVVVQARFDMIGAWPFEFMTASCAGRSTTG